MRLSADLIAQAVPHVNPIREWELQLRGCTIPAIENTGTTKDQYDCIDLSDNQIQHLGNFARLERLVTLLLNNNVVNRVEATIGKQLPNLETLVLTNCRVASLTEIDAIASLKKLQHLSLLKNPVTRIKNYRLYTIHKIPTLLTLDFTRVKQKERDAARALFDSAEGKAMEKSVNKAKSKTFAIGNVVGGKEEERPLLPEERAAFEAALASTTTPEEVDKVERMLKAGAFRKNGAGSNGKASS